MLGSMGIKGGTVLYHIGYGITLNCPAISGVIVIKFVAWVHQLVSLVCLLWQLVEKF
jgi:hypothetical protein